MGGLPLYIIAIEKIDIYNEMKFVPIAHYFVMLSALLPAIFYYLYRLRLISRWWFAAQTIIAIFILLNTLSRQLIILAFISFFITFVRVNRVNEKRVLLFAALASGLLFFGIGELRINAIDLNNSSLDYLKVFSDVPLDLSVNTFDVTFNLYTSLNLDTLNTVAQNNPTPYLGAYTIRPIIDIFHLNGEIFPFISESNDTFKILATAIADPLLDFGLAGVCLFGFLYGWLGKNLFIRFIQEESLADCLLWSSFVYCMLMSVFANFFNVLFFWICLLVAWIFSQTRMAR